MFVCHFVISKTGVDSSLQHPYLGIRWEIHCGKHESNQPVKERKHRGQPEKEEIKKAKIGRDTAIEKEGYKKGATACKKGGERETR